MIRHHQTGRTISPIGARESRCTRGQIRKNTIVVRVIIGLCLVFTHPSLILLFFPFFLIFLLPYVIFTMRARMIEVTTVGSRLRVSRDDDLELFSIPFAPRLSPPRRLNATTRATTTSREAKFEANEAEMSLTTQLPSRGSEWNVKTRPQFCITGKTLIPGTGHNFRDLFFGCPAVYSAPSEWTLHPLSISSN